MPGGRGEAGKGRATAVRDGRPTRVSLLSRLARFLREVVAELRKVIWPTRKQLVTYTIVVLVFVSFMVALVACWTSCSGRPCCSCSATEPGPSETMKEARRT